MDYTTSDVAQILGLSPAQVRRHAHSGYVEPRRGKRNEFLFSFQDLIVLRVVSELIRGSIPARRVRRSLEKLREQLPAGRSLTAVRVSAAGEEIVVQDGSASWEPDSGQFRLGFDVRDLAERVEPFARRAAATRREEHPEMDADELFDFALELEVVAIDEAISAYETLLATDGDHVEANVNLGRLFHESGDFRRAEAHYRRAIGVDPSSAVAWFNLGVVQEDSDRVDEAIASYERSIELDATSEEALFNLAQLYERKGERGSAIRVLRALQSLRSGR